MNRIIQMTRRLVFSAMFLALALVLPFLTGQIPEIGAALCPMHLPALLCGFICGWPYALAVGAVAPLLRSILFGMPPLLTAIPMAFELTAYGVIAAVCYAKLRKSKRSIYASLIAAMIGGRIVWGTVRFAMMGLRISQFGLAAFWAGAVANSIPGIIVQIVLVPVIVMALEKAKLTLKN